MTITMQNAERLTLAEMQAFVGGSGAVDFAAPEPETVYGFIQRVLVAQQFRRLRTFKNRRISAGLSSFAFPIVTVIDHRMRNSETVPKYRLKHFHDLMFKIILCWKRLPPAATYFCFAIIKSLIFS